MIPCGGIKIRSYFNSPFEIKLDSELQICFFMPLYWFFVFHQPRGIRRFSLAAPGRVAALAVCDEIFKGVNPFMKLLERLRAATAPVQSVTVLGQEKDQWTK